MTPILSSYIKVPPLQLIQRIYRNQPTKHMSNFNDDQGTVLHRLLRCQIIPDRHATAESKESIARILIEANPNCLRIADLNGWFRSMYFARMLEIQSSSFRRISCDSLFNHFQNLFRRRIKVALLLLVCFYLTQFMNWMATVRSVRKWSKLNIAIAQLRVITW